MRSETIEGASERAERGQAAHTKGAPVNIDLDQVKLLLEMVGETDISELTIEVEEERITIKKRFCRTSFAGSWHSSASCG